MGNPNAPVKLVEYGSLTCPHCKQFSDEATAALRDTYVRSGQVSWEFRNFLLGGPDLALSLLSRCQPPAAFFSDDRAGLRPAKRIHRGDRPAGERADQRAAAGAADRAARPGDGPRHLFARRGMPEARFSQCIGDRPADPAAHRADPARRHRGRRAGHADLLHQRRRAARPAAGASWSRCCARRWAAEMRGAAAPRRSGRHRRSRRCRPPTAPRSRARPPRSATGPRPSSARPKAASGWAIPMRR